MNHSGAPFRLTITLCGVLHCFAASAAPGVKAFPTAEGFGASAVGGRGGSVIEVTNLNDSGEGSLRAAMEASGPRICVFRVSGTISLRNNVIYNWSGNNASVFGQFALNSSAFGNVVNNLWIAGPEGGYPYLNVGNGGPTRIDGKQAELGGTKIFLSGNWGPRSPSGSTNDWTLETGAPRPPIDSDHDGMPDDWEKAHGFDAQNSGDGKSVAKNGYTNLENYLNELAGDSIP